MHHLRIRVCETHTEVFICAVISLCDEDSDIKYEYNVKEKRLYIKRHLYTNPLCHAKEYEERKCQLDVCMDRTGIPCDCRITGPNYAISFGVKIGLPKPYATPENITIIKDILIELSKEDYNQNLYAKFPFDDDWLYVETYHYSLLRAILVSADGTIECASPDVNTHISTRFSSLLDKAAKISVLDNVKPSDIIEQKVFEDLWDEKIHCADIQS